MSEIMRTSSAEDIEEAGEVTSRQVKAMQAIDRWGVLFLVVIMVVIGFLLHPDIFLGERNVLNIVRQNSVIALLALGQFIVIVTAGIDLSVGSVVALAMMSAALLVDAGAPWILAFMAPFLVGLAVGTINGLGLTKLHMPHPFIMTLGMLFIVRGISNIISDGRPISGMPDEIRFLGGPGGLEIGEFLIPTPLFVVLITYFVVWVFLQHTRPGRHIFAIGGNPAAARVSGVKVDRTLVLAYALCGLLAGFGGLMLTGRTNSGFPDAGNGFELIAISAVIIGGASFFGGRGTVLGVLAGVLVLGILRNLLNLSNVQPFWQNVVIGVVIISVVAFDVFRRRVAANG